MLLPVRGSLAVSTPDHVRTAPSWPGISDAAPGRPLSVAFIHHSCGGQLLATEGPDRGKDCIYESHPSGGGLRDALAAQGYVVHEASYGSTLGDKTDLFDWAPKLETKMDAIVHLKHQDEALPAGERNQIVVFKSCFPNNQLVGEGVAPGSSTGPALEVENAKAALRSWLPAFAAHEETLFVYVTAPPVAPRSERMPAYRVLLRALRGRGEPEWTAQQAGWARTLNDWVVAEDGWLADYPKKNVAVFDLYGALTGEGRSNLLAYTGEDDSDSHASAEGNRIAAAAFVPFLNRAVRRAFPAGTGAEASPSAPR